MFRYLLESFFKNATEQIPLYIVVPDQALPAITEMFTNHATVLLENF